jgi:hypothetical protein
MPRLYSYVVQHDHGFAPSLSPQYCTLVKCKFKHKRPNIVERAEIGDWIAGTGGADLKLSAGHGKLIYAMRVDEKLPLSAYYADPRFAHHLDHTPECSDILRTSALVSSHYFYFGRSAIPILEPFLSHPLEKKGPHYRKDFSQEFIHALVAWLESRYTPGIHGAPCRPLPIMATTIPFIQIGEIPLRS